MVHVRFINDQETVVTVPVRPDVEVAHDFAAIKNRFHLLSISNFAVSSAQFIFSYEKADVFRAPASNLI